MSENKDKLLPLKIGDPVIHKLTGLCGRVEAVESHGTTDGQLLTVALLSGRRMRAIPREEFGLHTPGAQQVREQTHPVWAVPTADDPHPITVDQSGNIWKNMGPISDESILDELC
jgi:hypothetical protein